MNKNDVYYSAEITYEKYERSTYGRRTVKDEADVRIDSEYGVAHVATQSALLLEILGAFLKEVSKDKKKSQKEDPLAFEAKLDILVYVVDKKNYKRIACAYRNSLYYKAGALDTQYLLLAAYENQIQRRRNYEGGSEYVEPVVDSASLIQSSIMAAMDNFDSKLGASE